MINIKYIVFILITSLLLSCHQTSEEENFKAFDSTLIEQNEEIRLFGNYKNIVALNIKYYKDAQEKGYDGGKALCYINLAYASGIAGNYRQALFLLEKARGMLENSKNKLHLAWLYDGYSDLNYFLELYSSALNYNNQALQAMKEVNNTKIREEYLSLFYLKKGQILFEIPNYIGALENFHKAEKIKERAYTKSWIANVYVKINKPDSAYYYVIKAQHAMERERISLHNVHGSAVYFFSGNYYNLIGDYPEAEASYLKASNISTETKNIYGPFFTLSIYKAMAAMYRKAGNLKQEHFYRTLYSYNKENVNNKQKEAINLTTEKFISEIEKNEQKKKLKIQFIIGLIILITLIVNFYTFKKIRYLKNKKRLLQYNTQKLEKQLENNKFIEIIEMAKQNHSAFLVKFEELYPDFASKLKDINGEIESSEIAFCAMIKLNFTSKEIASYTYIQHASVQQRKRRIRRKLNIPSDVDLYQFFNNL